MKTVHDILEGQAVRAGYLEFVAFSIFPLRASVPEVRIELIFAAVGSLETLENLWPLAVCHRGQCGFTQLAVVESVFELSRVCWCGENAQGNRVNFEVLRQGAGPVEGIL